jgi:NAD+ synthase (glutamine-hydrolysing)
MKISLNQINPTVGDFASNVKKICQFIDTAKAGGCDLVVFPELGVCGYPPGDLLERSDFVEKNLNALREVALHSLDIPVICGHVAVNASDSGNPLYNAASLLVNGVVAGTVYKQLLPTYDVFDERRFFAPGPPARPLMLKGCAIGLTICEDAWNDKDIFKRRIYETDPVEQLATAGADVIINISASPFHMEKAAFRERMLSTMASKYRLPVVFVNQVGGNDSLVFDGMSEAFDSSGRPVVRALEFEEDRIIFETGCMGSLSPIAPNFSQSAFNALVTGVRDYTQKCGFKNGIVGLSGGVDSALTLAVAAKALGPDNMTAVFMPSPYTSQDNFVDTQQLADNLGVRMDLIPIDPMFSAFTGNMPGICFPDSPGVTEQNIQARIRGTILMAYANKMNGLVLSTGNKSELSVGYCTLYGDMNGGLAVIADVWKTDVYRICRYINRDREIIPERILTKAPSAELKPNQRDQDDLPAYNDLDAILQAFIEEFKPIPEIVAMGYDLAMVEDVVRRVIQNEYKRYQAPPCIKVSAKAFGVGRRYPIAHRFRPL